MTLHASLLTPHSSLTAQLENLRQAFTAEPDLELAVLIGSRTTGRAHGDSDWDVAVQWRSGLDLLTLLDKTETLRQRLSRVLDVAETMIDLIDLPSARLALRAVVAEEGFPLKGEDSLAWQHFLTRTWRELEDFYWENTHAA